MKRMRMLLLVLALAFAALPPVESVAAAGTGCETMTEDVIITKYRTRNGKKQYRRWNKTKQCWVDPAWIDC